MHRAELHPEADLIAAQDQGHVPRRFPGGGRICRGHAGGVQRHEQAGEEAR